MSDFREDFLRGFEEIRIEHRLGYYRLGENGEVIAEPDVLAWARWYQTANRHVDQTLFEHGGHQYRVSTVFLGLDDQFFGHGPPILWETMVFTDDPAWDDAQWRYASRSDAFARHETIVAQVQRGERPDQGDDPDQGSSRST